jgi:hypothetical protein
MPFSPDLLDFSDDGFGVVDELDELANGAEVPRDARSRVSPGEPKRGQSLRKYLRP